MKLASSVLLMAMTATVTALLLRLQAEPEGPATLSASETRQTADEESERWFI